MDTFDNQVLNLDTIVAVASGSGKAGVGVIRLSGGLSLQIGETICSKTLNPRFAHFSPFNQNKKTIDQGIAIYFKGPFSYTGEDVVELQAHGGPVLLDILVQECIRLGARLATPGEFSERAFLNDRIDLTQAEAIADLIDASSEQAARSAMNTLQGVFSEKVHALVNNVIRLRVYIEAAIDFPEEEIDFLGDVYIKETFEKIQLEIESIIKDSKQGQMLKEGVKLVIIGKPNAGKSSLLNALAKKDVAIVTPIQGTTRDILKENILIDGLPIHIIDTAGLRKTKDVIEQEGVRRAAVEAKQADIVLVVNDASGVDGKKDVSGVLESFKESNIVLPEKTPLIFVQNKCDLLSKQPEPLKGVDGSVVFVSAKEEIGLNLLKQEIKDLVNFKAMGAAENSVFSARQRHSQALKKALNHLLIGKKQLYSYRAGELVAEDLKQCQQSLDEITGTFSSDALLGEIFSSFCIGK